MKLFLSLLALLTLPLTSHASPMGNSPWYKEIFIASVGDATKSAANLGTDYTSPKDWVTGNIASIPKNVVIEQAYVIVDTALTGATAVSLGDDDAATGFWTSATNPMAALGVNYFDVSFKGAYLKLNGSVANAKAYTVSTKHIVLTVTGTETVGKARVILKGYAF